MSEPRSTRQPWVRSALVGLVPLLLPFVWVLELDSCGQPAVPRATDITGTMVVGKFELDGWAVVIPVLLVVVLTPFLAPRIQRLGARVFVHALGLLATVFAAWGAFFAMLFTIFSERSPKGAGWLVLAAFAAAIIDAGLRFGWSLQEWLRSRVKPASP